LPIPNRFSFNIICILPFQLHFSVDIEGLKPYQFWNKLPAMVAGVTMMALRCWKVILSAGIAAQGVKIMNFNELARRLAAEFSMTQADARKILKFILDQIAMEVSNCTRVYFRGFGSFMKELKPARRYRDPVSGQMKQSPEDLRVRFRSFFNI
jgi:nucleoid DNA-binding protein